MTAKQKIDGSIVENIKQYSEVCGVSTYIYKQKIYCRPITDGDNLHFNINADTGLIDSPEPFEEENTSEKYVDKVTGYNCTMILQHRLSTAGIVNLTSVNYSGEYRVKSGVHSYDGLSATTEFKCIDTVSTTIDETKVNKASNSSSSKDDKTDWETIYGRRNWAVRYAITMAEDERYGYTTNKHWMNDSFKYDSINFVLKVWLLAGVDKITGIIQNYHKPDIITRGLEHCGFERVKTFEMWGSTCADLEVGDIIQNPNALVASDTVLAIYIGDNKIVRASIADVTETAEGWAADGDNDGTEICICDYKSLYPKANTIQYWRIMRYMGTDLPKLA